MKNCYLQPFMYLFIQSLEVRYCESQELSEYDYFSATVLKSKITFPVKLFLSKTTQKKSKWSEARLVQRLKNFASNFQVCRCLSYSLSLSFRFCSLLLNFDMQ